MNRPQYDHVDNEDREAQLSSRTETISKSFVTDLWMKVLHRAIDDVVLYKTMRMNGTPLKEEDLEFEQSAYDFLFDDDYRIPMDDYQVVIKCANCDIDYLDKMSILAANYSECPKCKTKQDEKMAHYKISDTSQVKDISLSELLEMWNIDDIDGFRRGAKLRIEFLIKKKQEAAMARAKVKGNNMTGRKRERVIEKIEIESDNFDVVTEEQLSDFDSGIIQVLDEVKEMLMAKNRKYGNSATNPIRAFSKADPIEQIRVRMDDKISRLVRSKSNEDDEDVPADLLGYLTIYVALKKGYIQ